MDSQSRRIEIETIIMNSDKPISASALAKQFHVSRQLIVGDVALLRAAGKEIVATPRGYALANISQKEAGVKRTIAVMHQSEALGDEIYTIVDMGGQLLDVIVEHPLYGQLCGNLHILSRYDADQFMKQIACDVKPLSNLTNGLHLHTIRAHDEETMLRILEALQNKGILYKE